MASVDDLLAAHQLKLGQLRAAARAKHLEGDALDQQAKLVEARIEGILEARQALDDETSAPAKAKVRQRHRPLSDQWKAILTSIAMEENEFDYDALGRHATRAGHEVTRDTLRSQMSGYKAAGFVEPRGGGRFRLTDAGRAAAGINKNAGAHAPKQNEPPEGGSDVGSVGAANTDWAAGFNLSRPVGAGERE